MWCLFVIADMPGLAVSGTDRTRLTAGLRALDGLAHARIMTPDQTEADQPFAADGAGPALALQLYFGDRARADAALAAGSALAGLSVLSGLPAERVSHQLMTARPFSTGAAPPPDPCLTFLVTYPGTAPDRQGWLEHYDAHHPPIMVRFPGIREVETYRPIEWASGLPFARSDALQRNKVVFASLADLLASLASPVMDEMRADGRGFPPFTGKATHFPMTTWRVGA